MLYLQKIQKNQHPGTQVFPIQKKVGSQIKTAFFSFLYDRVCTIGQRARVGKGVHVDAERSYID